LRGNELANPGGARDLPDEPSARGLGVRRHREERTAGSSVTRRTPVFRISANSARRRRWGSDSADSSQAMTGSDPPVLSLGSFVTVGPLRQGD